MAPGTDVAASIPPRVMELFERLRDAGFQAYVVGGSVRDVFLGREPYDWDLTTNALPEQVLELFPNRMHIRWWADIAKLRLDIGKGLVDFDVGLAPSHQPDQLFAQNRIVHDIPPSRLLVRAVSESRATRVVPSHPLHLPSDR
jgi:hypothetical protein